MHEQKVTQSSHYSTENKRDNSDLIITGIKEDDAGIYICQINTEPIRNKVIFSMPNMFQKVFIIHTLIYIQMIQQYNLQIFRLFVHRPPWNLTSNLSRRRLEAKVGTQVGLTCSAKGNPKPKITWKRRDNKRLRIIDKKQSFRQG